MAFVTGASSGIGEQFARQLAESGHDLVLVGRSTERLDALARELEKYHDCACEVLDADLSSAAGRERALLRVGAGDVETLVNAAGFGSYGEIADRTEAELEAMVACNVLALTLLSHAALGPMLRRRRGAVCNVASTAAFAPAAGAAVYHATKAYVTSLSQAMHEEGRRRGVHVTVVCPGFTPTAFHARAGIRAERVPVALTTDAATVARRGLEALARNQAVCVPAPLDRALLAALRLTPPAVVRRSTASVVRRLAEPVGGGDAAWSVAP
jgi:short-subunit dehydrogenase